MAKPKGCPITRFWKHVDYTSSRCWLWDGRKDGDYGHFYDGTYSQRSHRFAYEWAFGEIPPGLVVCHSCDVRPCVKPSHLWLGTRQDNQRDMKEKGRARNANTGKPLCKRGHPFSGANLYVLPNGERSCRTCAKAAQERYLARRRLQREASQ